MTPVKSRGPILGIRHLQALLIFLDIVVIYNSRIHVSVALVAMTNGVSTNPDIPRYDWDEQQKALVISSFYWGYAVTQFPGAYLVRRFGARITMFIATFGTSVLSLIMPLCIPWGQWQAFCAIRLLQGLIQGMMFPAIHQHISKWAPVTERNRLGALSHQGIECGTVFAMALSGIIAESSIGWPGISYVSAALSFAWSILWFIFGANNPVESRFISNAERLYIETSLQHSEDFHKKKIPVPWRAIFTSVPFIVFLFTRCCQAWGFVTVQAEIPLYFNGVLDMNIKSNGFYSALPYLCMWIMSNIFMVTADVLLKKQVLSLNALRKTFNTIAFWGPTATLIGVGFMDADSKNFAIALFSMTMGMNGANTLGSLLNTIDLSPNHAGILMGIMNTAVSIVPIITPIAVSAIVTDETDRMQWQIAFIVAAVAYFLGNCAFLIGGSTDKQVWDDPEFLLPKDVENKDAASDIEKPKEKGFFQQKLGFSLFNSSKSYD